MVAGRVQWVQIGGIDDSPDNFRRSGECGWRRGNDGFALYLKGLIWFNLLKFDLIRDGSPHARPPKGTNQMLDELEIFFKGANRRY